MTKQQRQLLVTAVSVAMLLGFVVWRSVRVGNEVREQLAAVDAEQPPPVIPNVPTTPDDLVRSMEALLRALAQATDTLEANHLQRREAKAKGMPFPEDLDASSRLLKAKSLEQLTGLERLIDENIQRTLDQRIVDKLFVCRKHAQGLRDVLQRTDFGPDPEPKK